MVERAKAINSFASEAKQVDVSPVEESIFVLTASQLQEIISKAVLEATEPLYREMAYDRQRIAKLEQREPQPLQRDRGDILKALLAANGGKMLAKDARKKMRLPKNTFSALIKTMKESSDIEVKRFHLNSNWRVLILK